MPAYERGIDLNNAYFIGLATIFLFYAIVSYVLHKMCVLFPLVLHVGLIYTSSGAGLPILVAAVWFFNMGRKMFHPKAENLYQAMQIPTSDPLMPARTRDLRF